MMSKRILFTFVAVLALAMACSTCLHADEDDSPGQNSLDQATELKLQATSLSDLKKVIELCEKAKKEGLSGDNLAYCNQLLAASQLQTGNVVGQALLSQPPNRFPVGWELMRDSALNYLEAAVKVIQEQPEPFLLISELNRLPNGDAKRAEEALDQALAKAADDKQMRAKLLTIKAVHSQDKELRTKLLDEALELEPDAVETLMAAAAHFADENQLDKAVTLLEQVIASQPENIAAISVLTAVFAKQQNYDKAIETLNALQKLMPGNPAPLVEKAKILIQKKDLDQALTVLDESLAIDSMNPATLLLRATLRMEKSDFDAAMKDLNSILKFSPDAIIPLRLKAQILARQDKFDEAIQLLNDVREKVGDLPEIMLDIAKLLSFQKKNREALELLDRVVAIPQLKEDALDIWCNAMQARGDMQLSMNQYSNAVKSYEAAMEFDTDNYVLINNLAWVLATSPVDMVRDPQRSLELALRANELSEGKEAFVLSTVAAAYAENIDFEKAMEYIQKGLDLAKEAKDVTPFDIQKNEEQLQHLQKEYESYKEGRPWREINEE